MADEIIPAGVSGRFRITEQMMFDAGAASMALFEDRLRVEASRRGLSLLIEREQPSGDVIVSWRPGEWCTLCPDCHPGKVIAEPCGRVHDCAECAAQRAGDM